MKTDRNTTPYSHLKVFYHQEIMHHLLKGERCNPLYIRIKPTNRCNHNCDYCHYRSAYLDLDEYNPTDEIPHDKMMEIIDDMACMGVRAVTFSGGGGTTPLSIYRGGNGENTEMRDRPIYYNQR